MTKPPATAEASQNSGASSILVWNGLVTTIRRIGGEKRNWARVDVDRSLERGREANASGEPKERWGVARTRRASGPTPDSPQDQWAGAAAKAERWS